MGKILHDSCRTVVRDLSRAGVPQAIAKKITGHKTDAVYNRYNIVTTEDTLAALESRRIFLDQRSKKSNVVKLRAANADKKTDS